MGIRPDDLDATRSVIAARELTATASGYLTTDVAMGLPFEALGPFKTALKRFFSTEPWNEADTDALSELIVPHLAGGWWEHDLGAGISIAYGIRDGRFELWVTGAATPVVSIFDRVFDGPVIPEATPHPRKVKFTTGGTPAPGVWYRRSDRQPDDVRVQRVFAEPYVTDVMVAGDFVTVGIGAKEPWERRLEPLLALVTELFADPDAVQVASERTRDGLLAEARSRSEHRPEELHLLDPDDPDDRSRLLDALEDSDVRVRRVAVAVLLESRDGDVRHDAATRGAADPSRVVRRTAIDAAADTEEEHFRALFEGALGDDDAWIRWKAVRSLGALGLASSMRRVEVLADDPDFQVRFEVAKVLREDG
ncbi:hypothetical protein BMS3Abin02_01231 [bacterium BMS3Abin02]|nr:hypothetical protein BMS3Abin02_01231 [bacterium BMS3Abin02]